LVKLCQHEQWGVFDSIFELTAPLRQACDILCPALTKDSVQT